MEFDVLMAKQTYVELDPKRWKINLKYVQSTTYDELIVQYFNINSITDTETFNSPSACYPEQNYEFMLCYFLMQQNYRSHKILESSFFFYLE